LLPVAACAHPGWGIVLDQQGNLFYTDLENVWRMDAAGRKTVAVAHVHTHELALDRAGNLYGEDSRNEGSKLRHRLWKRSPTGQISDVRPWTEGFREDYGIARDAAGATYFLRHVAGQNNQVYQRTASGQLRRLAPGYPFPYIVNQLAVAPDNSVYVASGGSLLRLDTQGNVRTIARNLAPTNGRHALMGIWPDAQDNVYVADLERRRYLRVRANGTVETLMQSPVFWQPTGLVQAPNGAFWVLEYSATQARVRRIVEQTKKCQ
jgi:DNA-binding beta-propeller fold protein YncE